MSLRRHTLKEVGKQIEVQTRQVQKAKAELDKMVAERQKQVDTEIDRLWEEREARDLQEQE